MSSMRVAKDACRCGHSGEGPHPCHWAADGTRPYTCRKPATHRFYGAHITCLAGVQPKLGMHDTWACDECWGRYQATQKKETA